MNRDTFHAVGGGDGLPRSYMLRRYPVQIGGRRFAIHANGDSYEHAERCAAFFEREGVAMLERRDEDEAHHVAELKKARATAASADRLSVAKAVAVAGLVSCTTTLTGDNPHAATTGPQGVLL